MTSLRTWVLLLVIGPIHVVAFIGTTTRPPWATFGSVGPRPLGLSSRDEEETVQEGECLSIEYCTGCRWMLRSAWMAQELLTTFQDELDSVTLIPCRPPAPGGIFTVRRNDVVLWDRREDGGFPEAKELKQRVRDLIAPSRFLGHSDTVNSQQEHSTEEPAGGSDCEECTDVQVPVSESIADESKGDGLVYLGNMPSPNVAIVYCTGCRWLLKAAYYAQELLTTFDTELNSVTLVPSRPPEPGGTFIVDLDGELIWDRSAMERFPEMKELKQLIRDEIAPTHDLGHSDRKPEEGGRGGGFEDLGDDEAADARRFFGVM